MTIIRNLGAGSLMLALATATAFAEEKEAWRLFVSDHAQAGVAVVDLGDRKILDKLPTDGPAALHRTASGETVFAVQGAEGRVVAFRSGIAFDDHGDHGDIEITDAKLLEFALSGTKPAHFVERQGNIAMWFDGEDKARLFSERDAQRGNLKTAYVDVQAAHHGVGVPFGTHAVVTVPNPEDPTKRPIGARVVKGEAEQVGEISNCPGLHGSAGSGNLYALACDTGLLIIEARDGVPQIRHLAYPASLPDGSSSTLLGGKGIQYFVGNYGADRIVLIDPSEAEGFRLVQLPTRRVNFVTDPVRSKFIYVFTEDGALHRVDFLSGEIDKSLALTAAYSMDGHWSDPRPRVAVAGDSIVVTDPLAGKLHLVDAESFEKNGEIAIDGKPFNIVAVGGGGQVHQGE